MLSLLIAFRVLGFRGFERGGGETKRLWGWREGERLRGCDGNVTHVTGGRVGRESFVLRGKT